MNPQFAVLIKGEWGSGKTFLEKKILTETYGENYKDKVIWLSVYGISDISQLRQKLFEKIHPVLTHKITKFALATLKAGVKASTTFDFNNNNQDDLSLDLSIPNFDDTEHKAKIKKLLIVDDIERCSIPMSELFGFFSEEILENDVRAIFIANDKKIEDAENEKNDYKSIKEKVIGMEFEVSPDTENAVTSFIQEIGLDKNKELLLNQTVEVLENLQYKNLRSVRQAFVHINQILVILGEGKLDEKYIADVIKYFLVLFIQKANGEITTQDDFLDAIEAYAHSKESFKKSKEKEIDKNAFKFRYAKIPLQNFYFEIISKGIYNKDAILQNYLQWTSPTDNRTPYKKLVSEWFNFSDKEFNSYYNSVQKEFDENRMLNQAQIVGWADFNFELSECGIIKESILEIKDKFLGYVSRNKEHLEEYNVAFPLRSHFTRCKTALKELTEIEDALKVHNGKLRKTRLTLRFKELYSDIETNIVKLIDFITKPFSEDDNSDIALLSLIDIQDFYNHLKTATSENQVTLYQSFEERYEKKYFNGELKKEYFPDVCKVKELYRLYAADIKDTFMSPEMFYVKLLTKWYEELYEYMLGFLPKNNVNAN